MFDLNTTFPTGIPKVTSTSPGLDQMFELVNTQHYAAGVARRPSCYGAGLGDFSGQRRLEDHQVSLR